MTVSAGGREIPARPGTAVGKEMAAIVEIQDMQQYRWIDQRCAIDPCSVDSPVHLESKRKRANA